MSSTVIDLAACLRTANLVAQQITHGQQRLQFGKLTGNLLRL
jgi:hypothetical protein